jgi:hypothetical protein
MQILETLVSVLLKPVKSSPFSIMNIGGCFFLALGGGIGFWFLFQSLIPLIGYLQSGAVMTALFLGIGGGLLLWNRRKKPELPIVTILGEAQELYKCMNMEKVLKKNSHIVLLAAFMGGIVLSQVREGKKLAPLKDKLPQICDLLRHCIKS